MPASKRKPDPLTPLKQAVRITTRSMAGDRKLEVTFTGEQPGFDGKTALALLRPGVAGGEFGDGVRKICPKDVTVRSLALDPSMPFPRANLR